MSRLLTVARLLVLTLLLNFISCTFLVISGFKHWDIAACAASAILSLCIVHIEVSNKWSCHGRESFTNILIMCVLLGGASAFFWFFHMIYKIGHYQGDNSDLFWYTATKIIAFSLSVQLILKAHRFYTSLTLEFVEDNSLVGDVTPLTKTELAKVQGCSLHLLTSNGSINNSNTAITHVV